jgi:hypothetical protein
MTGNTHRQLLDSGADRELVGRKYADKHKLKSRRLKQPVTLRYMDGHKGSTITHATWQKLKIPGKNGTRTFMIKYLIADIPEGLVLGYNWLQWANPDINWKEQSLTWREDDKVLIVRKARQQVIQGAIAANEPPDWVKKEFPTTLIPQPQTLPPFRGDMDYQIRLKPGFTPKRDPPRRFSPEERREFGKLAEKEVAAGRWKISKSPQAVQMLWAAKAGATEIKDKRPCIDYRRLNQWITDDAYPIPLINDMLTDLSGKKWYSSLDLPKAYWSIRIKDQATRELMAFECNGVLYEPQVLQFGVKTAVAHFQRVIMTILGDVLNQGVRVYLDNIVVAADTKEEHDRLVRIVLERLRKHNLSIQPSKCEWFKKEVQFCGYLISEEGIRLDPEKIRAIVEWEPPRSGGKMAKTKVREFNGFCNFYRDSVDNYSDIAAPLTTLTGATTEWKWTDKEETAWNMIKTAILSAPIRAAFQEGVPVQMRTDSSDEALAAILEHKYACGHTRPIAFHSKKFNKAEQNYTVHDKELLAIVRGFEKFHTWVYGHKDPIKVYSDHQALRHFMTTTKLTQRHARWAEKLGEYNFIIQHVKGKDNAAADALSRKDRTGEYAGGGIRPLQEKHFEN